MRCTLVYVIADMGDGRGAIALRHSEGPPQFIVIVNILSGSGVIVLRHCGRLSGCDEVNFPGNFCSSSVPLPSSFFRLEQTVGLLRVLGVGKGVQVSGVGNGVLGIAVTVTCRCVVFARNVDHVWSVACGRI